MEKMITINIKLRAHLVIHKNHPHIEELVSTRDILTFCLLQSQGRRGDLMWGIELKNWSESLLA